MLHIRLYVHGYPFLACVVMSELPYVPTIRNGEAPPSSLYVLMEPARDCCPVKS
jgi:hypothetical protein